MRIVGLRIQNFRAIERFEVDGLGDFILIAGPNGCGKTTVLDAVRLLKSVYVQDEWRRWFQEFTVDLNHPVFSSLLRDQERDAVIAASFELDEQERAFLDQRAENIALALVLNEQRALGKGDFRVSVTGDAPLLPPSLTGPRAEELRGEAQALAGEIRTALKAGRTFTTKLQFSTEPPLDVSRSPIATACFSCFSPDSLGEVEFHSSRRIYYRESVTNIRLKVGDRGEERRNRFLYDLENKYKNIKTQLGEEYVSQVLRREDPQAAPLQQSIKELFLTFFPGKEFLGVTLAADNTLSFPVRLRTGQQHDIDELSSGEKEIVYGYLWLRTSTPRRSVVLVDEPELHLNPALVSGLPSFYKRHISDALNAQVWVVTHSDAILRQGVRVPSMAVYHMAKPQGNNENQAIRIGTQDEIEDAVIDLIGDLAAYRPYARIVLVEGHNETRFDVDVIKRLFPDLAERGNFIPMGSRRMTAGVRSRLQEVLSNVGLAGRAVSISDGDLGLVPEAPREGDLIWPVYEIENFLLDPSVLRRALTALLRREPYPDDAAVLYALRELARPLVNALALTEIQHVLNEEFVRSIAIGGAAADPLGGLISSASGSKSRVGQVDATEGRIRQMFDEAVDRLTTMIDSDQFLVRFPGDRLLRAVAGAQGLAGEVFRNACLDQAQRLGLRPPGMETTLLAALA